MYYNQSHAGTRQGIALDAAKGAYSGSGYRHQLNRSMQRAAVNISRTEDSYEMLVFAPGRIKENFDIRLKGQELTVAYVPPEGFPRPEWVRREYSRGAFERSFILDETINSDGIKARYADGVLEVTLPIVPIAVEKGKEIPIS